MTQGCLIFAHDSNIDYGSQAVLAARLVNKYLNVPVSLVTDDVTLDNLNAKFDNLPFDKIITTVVDDSNLRYLPSQDHTGQRELVSFINGGRERAWELTPYDRTLIIDSDFLVFSNTLNKYWKDQHDFLICPKMTDLQSTLEEQKISSNTIKLLWATNIMFTKNADTKILFDLVKYIKEEYRYFAGLYEFDARQYRNDFAFSIAAHILGAHGLSKWHGVLASPLMFSEYDEIVDVKGLGDITIMSKNIQGNGEFQLVRCQGQDIHIMNKRDLLANLTRIMELI